MGFSWRYVDHALPLHHQKTKNRNYYYEEILDHIGYWTIGTDLLACGDSADSSSSEGVEKVWRHCRVCRVVAHALIHVAIQSKEDGGDFQ